MLASDEKSQDTNIKHSEHRSTPGCNLMALIGTNWPYLPRLPINKLTQDFSAILCDITRFRKFHQATC